MSYITYPTPTAEQFRSMGSEIAKYRHLVAPYCAGAGVDIGTQGDPVVPWAMSFDIPESEFLTYTNGMRPKGPIHLRGHADHLPFDSGSLDWLGSSHYLEDELDFVPILSEWCRCVRVGGFLWNIGPEKDLWNAAVARGQPPNCSHAHELRVGELTEIFGKFFGHFEVLKDELTNVAPDDYSLWFVAQRTR